MTITKLCWRLPVILRTDRQNCIDLRKGMLKALRLRAMFWDWDARSRPAQGAMRMTEPNADVYDRSAPGWKRTEPILLSDFTVRPFLLS